MIQLTDFVYAPMAIKGGMIKRYPDDIDMEPRADMVIGKQEPSPTNTEWADDNYGRTTRMTAHGLELKTEGRFLYKLNDVVVTQNPPGGHPLWWIEMYPQICAIEACPWRARYAAGKDPESHSGPIIDMGPNGKLFINLKPKMDVTLHVKEPTVFHAHSWEDNYYHKVLDSLPRAWATEEGLIPRLPLERRDHLCVRYDTLYFPSFWPASGFSPRPIHWLRNRYKKHRRQKKHTAVYFSRRDAQKRRALNEDAILGLLKKMGLSVTCVAASALSFERQIEIAEESQIIIGPHGAAITNAIWGNNAGVVEFLPSGHPHIVYRYMTKWSGGWYGCIICDAPKDGDMIVPLDAVEAAVKEAILETA